ncbi:hypothetical protein COOONC_18853 [Cooperia oncophora]
MIRFQFQFLPETFCGPYIPRAYQYRIKHDKEFKGGFNIHAHFFAEPRRDLMFAHDDDILDCDYFIQEYIVSEEGWQRRADSSLKLWRKLKEDKHPILKAFKEDLKTYVLVGTQPPQMNVLKGCEVYSTYVSRFMLIAMRGRQRCGRIVTIDDALFSYCMIPDFLRITQEAEVTVGVRLGFVKAMIAFFKFLRRHVDPNAGKRRRDLAKEAYKSLRHYLKNPKQEERSAASFKGGYVVYAAMRAVVDHSVIDSIIEDIMKKFSRNAKALLHAEYNFVMSALIAYIMVCNATRNEVAYKTICGSVVEVNTQSMGLIKHTQETKDYWVARFPNPKQRTMSRELTTCKSGLFGLDKKSHRWLQYYRKLRASLVSQRDDISREEDQFFLLWSGTPVSFSSVSPLLRRFFKILNCEEMAITCNAVRHAASTSQFDTYMAQKKGDTLDPADANVAMLMGHTQKTQLLHYVDDFVEPAVRAYRCLQAMARRQQNLDEKEVLAVKRRVKFRGFHVVTEELSEAEAEEDCGPREPISGGESEDTEGSDTDDDDYVPSKPIGKVGDTTSVESRKSPRKQAQPSSPVNALSSGESDEGPTMKRWKPVKSEKSSKWNILNFVLRKKSTDAGETCMKTKKQTFRRDSMLEKRNDALPVTQSARDPYEFFDEDMDANTVQDTPEPSVVDMERPTTSREGNADSQFQASLSQNIADGTSLLNRRYRAMLDALLGKYDANLPLTAERLLLWVGVQSEVQGYLQLDTSCQMDSFEAFVQSNSRLCTEKTMVDPVLKVLEFTESNQLCKLLGVASNVAYRRSASVVLLLKSVNDQSATIVLPGELISPRAPKAYSSCVGFVDGDGGKCYPVRACTPETEEPTLAEEFGSGEVLHFRTRNDEMWFELLSDPRLKLQHALETMRQYHVLQHH